jgi:hypothetical protein
LTNNKEDNMMNENSNPIEFLIEFAWANGADRFVVNNAKDELKKLKEQSLDTNRWLSCEKDLRTMKEKYSNIKQMYINLTNNAISSAQE